MGASRIMLLFLLCCFGQQAIADGTEQYFEKGTRELKKEYRKCKSDNDCTHTTDGTGCEGYRAVNAEYKNEIDWVIHDLDIAENCTYVQRPVPDVRCIKHVCQLRPKDPG